MKKLVLLISVLIITFNSNAQFNQKISYNFSAGAFKTFGERFSANLGSPYQMPNYLLGFSGNTGFQFRFGGHFSLSAEFGLMIVNRWNYPTADKENYLSWTVIDPATDEVLEEGEDFLDLRNWSVSIKPKFYLLNDKKWNPYFFAGININLTRCWFENNLWYALDEWGQLDPGETEPWNYNLEENSGIGFNPGFGVEYSPSGRFHFFMDLGYYFIAMKEENFKDPALVENFNAFQLQAGIRFNFMKVKDL
jgi:opacity protein-like surface antigen